MVDQPRDPRPRPRDALLRRRLWAAVAGVVAVGTAAAATLWAKREQAVDAGPATEYAVGSVRHFPDAGFFLVRRVDGFVALSHRCTHLVPQPCAVEWQPDAASPAVAPGADGWFRCPCHAATYRREDGDVLFGPAARPLDALSVRIVDGRVVVSVGGRTHQRQLHERPPVARL